MPGRDDITEQNRRAWNEIAALRGRRWAEKHPDALYRAGGTTLATPLREAAGDVRGKSILHLQCATGEDTLSWAVLGARATGVDISGAAIALARGRAATLGLDVRFVAADVYALPADMTGFDIVTTGGGSLVWLPDLAGWAQGIAHALAPGGKVVVWESHPVAGCLSAADGQVTMVADYFQRGRIEVEPAGWTHFDDRGQGTEPKYEFCWPLGEVVTSLARTGLRIEQLEEFPTADEDEWRYGDLLDQVRAWPGWYLLVASKPGGQL